MWKNPAMFTTSMFVSQLTHQGNALSWSTFVGGTTAPEYDYVSGIGRDASGSVVVSGMTSCHTWPVTPGAFQTQFPAGSGGTTYAGFVTRLDSAGHSLIYSTFLSPPSGGGAGNCAVDPSGIVTVVAGGQPGFPITLKQQKRWYLEVAAQAHARGLSVGMKNGVEVVDADTVAAFDWALNEECFQYHECGAYNPFIASGKAVFNVEYIGRMSSYCPKAVERQFSTLKKRLALGAWRKVCQPG